MVAGWINGSNLTFQKMDADGNPLWGADGLAITAPAGLTYSLADLHAGDDGSVIFSFVSAAGFTGPKHLMANKLSPTGDLLWGANHVAVFDGGSLQFGNFPPFVTDSSGGAVFGWCSEVRSSRARSTSWRMEPKRSRTTALRVRRTRLIIK